MKEKSGPWFQGRMNRQVAEETLARSNRLDGTFVLRESDALSMSIEPVYMISVMLSGETHHVEIEKLEDSGKYTLAQVEGGKSFKSVKKLIAYYRHKPLDLDGGGTVKLKYFIEG